MITSQEIIEKCLKDGRDYMYIGGERYRPGDCLLYNGQELTVKKILDQVHFFDQRNFCMHSYMYHEQKWEHCPERNADKKTKDRIHYAVIADKVRTEREKFHDSEIQNKPFQVYDAYNRIYFWETMCRHILKKEYDPNDKDSEALLKLSDKLTARGATLLADMYRHFLLKSENIGSKFDRERFVTGYIAAQTKENERY